MRNALVALAFLFTVTPLAHAQPGVLTKQQLVEYTPDWSALPMAGRRCPTPSSIG